LIDLSIWLACSPGGPSKLFDSNYIEEKLVMDWNPVYVAGLERSGTSLMYALLTSHPKIALTRRTNMWTHFYDQYGDLSEAENFERCLAAMMKYKRLVKLEPDPERLSSDFWQGTPSYGRLFGLLEAHYAERVGKLRWGDKSLNTERYATPIFEAYPEAKILHMIRDPRDRYASSLTRWEKSRGGVGAGTARWLSSMSLAKQNMNHYPDSYLIVRYETLASYPEETLKKISEFIGEEYSPQMLGMDQSGSYIEAGGNSSYGQREPGVISTDSIGRYRQVLSQRQIAFMQEHAGQEMQEQGYEIDPIQFSLSDKLVFNVADQPLNLARMLAWRTQKSIRDRRGRPLPKYRIVPDAGYTSV